MTLQDYIALTRRHITTLVLFLGVGIAIGAAWVLLKAPVYQASATAYVATNSGSSVGEAYSGTLLAQTKAKGYVPIVTSRQVASRVIEKLGLPDSPSALASRISATVTTDSNLIVVQATAGSPQAASDLANATVAAAADEVKKVETTVKSGSAASTTPPVALVPLESAAMPTSPISPRPLRDISLAGLVGLLLGYGVALLKNLQDTRIRSREDAETATGSSVIGTIPRSDALQRVSVLQLREQRDFHTAEALRQLRTNLRYVDVDHSPSSIVITSPRQGEGKSTIALSLATLIADSGEPVVLIDADLRRPAIGRFMGLDGTLGLSQVLAGSVEFADVIQATAQPNLVVLCAGETVPNPSELLGSQRMKQLIDKLAASHRVILDAPPLLPVTDAAVLTHHADGALLVLTSNESKREHVHAAVRALDAVQGRLLGVVLNNVNRDRLKRLIYGETTYGYEGYGDDAYLPAATRRGRKAARAR